MEKLYILDSWEFSCGCSIQKLQTIILVVSLRTPMSMLLWSVVANWVDAQEACRTLEHLIKTRDTWDNMMVLVRDCLPFWQHLYVLWGLINPLYSSNCRYSLNMQDILSRDRQSSSCESKCLSESTFFYKCYIQHHTKNGKSL